MIIYFVNKNSRIKGPYDILDSKRKRIINIGDICIREQEDKIDLMLVVSNVNKWNSCVLLGNACIKMEHDANMLLFEYNGTKQRQGNTNALEKLRNGLENTLLTQFFQNAVEILQYKRDFWEISVLENIYKYSSEGTNAKFKIKKEDVLSKIPLFASYLRGNAADFFKRKYLVSENIKNVYQEIKAKYPDEFRRALIQFLGENPSCTIYDD